MRKLWETLKTMSFKEAVDYIWEYYKLHIIGIIAAVVFLVSLLTTIFGKEEDTYELMIVSDIPYDVIEPFEQQINEQYFNDFRVAINNITSGGGSISELSYADVQKFWATIGASMADIIITNETIAQELVEQEGLLKIEEAIDLERLSDKNVQQYHLDMNDVYGIDTNQLAVFADYEVFQDKVVIIPINSENHAYTTEFLETLLQ
ncbi:hypothetical protein SH601_01110 [Gracilibacillus sp. S3-1-1]|uniref:Uncharacterized protein n=1 Tax=Gracilibacillus pellucidus TaxID=3095368 RepID=A0ACC6M110_9BACI|nr:hypothetical protein [Gracilibacillus sp. S3-1-1]MDX8044573.1 hypothetical protein [Gracilibacillus sp. S3-1-1]